MCGQFEIDETKRRVFTRDGWRCRFPGCPRPANELAHGIAQGEGNVRSVTTFWNQEYNESRTAAWIRENVIHHDLNLSASCRYHNPYFNIGNNPAKVRAKLQEIHDKIKTEDSGER